MNWCRISECADIIMTSICPFLSLFSDSLCIVSHEKGKNRIRMQFYNGSIEPPRLKLRCNTMLVHSVQYCKVQTIYKLLLFNQSISGMYHSYFEWQKLCTIYSEKPPPERVGFLLFFVSFSLRTLMMIKTHIRSTSLLTSETHFLSGKANAKAYYCIHWG